MASPPSHIHPLDIEALTATFTAALAPLTNQVTQLNTLITGCPKRGGYVNQPSRYSRPMSYHHHHRHHYYKPIESPPLEPIEVPADNIDFKKDLPKKALPDETDEGIIEPQEEISIEVEVSEVDLVPTVEEAGSQLIEDTLEPPKSFEVKNDVSIVVASEVLDQTQTSPTKGIVAYYPYTLDRFKLVWKRSQSMGVDPFWNFVDDLLVRPKDVIYDLRLHRNPEKLRDFQVNSRSSSFQVGVTDVDQFRPVLEFFRDFWKPKKRARKKKIFTHRGRADLAARDYGSRREAVAGFLACQLWGHQSNHGYLVELHMGAVLGCYMKSCPRSYHVPCAYDDFDCRWDCDDFLFLCPKHASHKFPMEQKSKAGKHDTIERASTHLNACNSFLKGGKNLVLCGSALSLNEKKTVSSFILLRNLWVFHGSFLIHNSENAVFSVVGQWCPNTGDLNVTHVVAAVDSKGACTRTLKVLMAILNGKWIVTVECKVSDLSLSIPRVKACVKAGRVVDEEPYEVQLDTHGCSGGPKAGRLRILNNSTSENRLFGGYAGRHHRTILLSLKIVLEIPAIEKYCTVIPQTSLIKYSVLDIEIQILSSGIRACVQNTL
ncbi:hypothetical protein OSB04_016285 [Centaurea solstitialis]|uniref:Uncharacterized protein n=1 Tax=Centaurea solstitialis TaxID=347529 RepID=A0AA38T0M9_9ASTR|nr:hypothetical protein OSB04_016285 [Centaurea solstitialis]